MIFIVTQTDTMLCLEKSLFESGQISNSYK